MNQESSDGISKPSPFTDLKFGVPFLQQSVKSNHERSDQNARLQGRIAEAGGRSHFYRLGRLGAEVPSAIGDLANRILTADADMIVYGLSLRSIPAQARPAGPGTAPGVRRAGPFGDIDVLVPRSDLERARIALPYIWDGIRGRLGEQAVLQCPACGYDLSAVPQGRVCPECGTDPRETHPR